MTIEPIEPKEFVASMVAEVEAGNDPGELQRFLQETFPRPARGWLARLVSSSVPKLYPIYRITPFDDGGLFRRSSVFEVVSSTGLLEGHILPSGGSFGLCSVTITQADQADPGYREAAPPLERLRFSYLSQNAAALEELLRTDGCALDSADPVALARLFSEILLRKGNRSADVIGSVDDLESYEGGISGGEDGYHLDESELARVQSKIQPPSVIETALGWRLGYCAVFGWMHQKTTLMAYQFDVDRTCRIEAQETILSPKIFDQTPMFTY